MGFVSLFVGGFVYFFLCLGVLLLFGVFFNNLYGNIINSDTGGEDTVSIQQIHMGQLE